MFTFPVDNSAICAGSYFRVPHELINCPSNDKKRDRDLSSVWQVLRLKIVNRIK
jgi:hypothetical protein